MNNVENQLKSQYHKETQGRLNGKPLNMDSLNIIQYLQAKKVGNTEIPLFNDVRHCKFLVRPGIIITGNNKLKRKCQE